MLHMKYIICFWGLLLLCLFPYVVTAQSGEVETLQVVTMEREPFFFQQGTGYHGFLAETWDVIAAEMGVNYDVIFVETLGEILDMMASGEADVAVMNLSITAERERIMDFTHVVYNDGYQIVIHESHAQTIDLWNMVRDTTLFGFLEVTVITILIVAHIVWYVERSAENSDFAPTYLAGIWDGIWWACVTMTSVGYGRQEPRRVLGRVVAIIWMFVGLIFFSLFMAEVTSSLTHGKLSSGIGGPDDIVSLTVGAGKDSVYEAFLLKRNIKTISFDAQADMWQALDDGTIDAVVTGSAMSVYYASTDGKGRVQLAGNSFHRDDNAFGLPSDSPYRDAINTALFVVRENGTYNGIYRRWITSP